MALRRFLSAGQLHALLLAGLVAGTALIMGCTKNTPESPATQQPTSQAGANKQSVWQQDAILNAISATAQAYKAAYGQSVKPPEGYQLEQQIEGELPGQSTARPFVLIFRKMDTNDWLIAFRGATQHAFDVEPSLWSSTMPFTADNGATLPGEVQQAAFLIYLSLQKPLFTWLEAHTPSSLTITGHSLGAQLADLFLADLAITKVLPTTPITAYTFGAPRVGNAAFASFMMDDVMKKYRLIAFNNIHDKATRTFATHEQGFERFADVYPLCFTVETPPPPEGSLLSIVGMNHLLKNYITVLQHQMANQPLPASIALCDPKKDSAAMAEQAR